MTFFLSILGMIVRSAVALHILWLVAACKVEGAELYWTWIGKIMAVVC